MIWGILLDGEMTAEKAGVKWMVNRMLVKDEIQTMLVFFFRPNKFVRIWSWIEKSCTKESILNLGIYEKRLNDLVSRNSPAIFYGQVDGMKLGDKSKRIIYPKCDYSKLFSDSSCRYCDWLSITSIASNLSYSRSYFGYYCSVENTLSVFSWEKSLMNKQCSLFVSSVHCENTPMRWNPQGKRELHLLRSNTPKILVLHRCRRRNLLRSGQRVNDERDTDPHNFPSNCSNKQRYNHHCI